MYKIKVTNNYLLILIPVAMLLVEKVLPGNQFVLPLCIVSGLLFHFTYFIRYSTYRTMHYEYKKLDLIKEITMRGIRPNP